METQQAELAADGHIVTRSQLIVYKVFKGQLPAGPLSVLTAGGTLGLRREETTGTLQLAAGQQGIFFLEADPAAPGEWRAYAGPQGFIAYNLAALTAAEPFGHYASIAADLYPALTRGVGAGYRTRQPNAALAAAPALKTRLAATQQLAATAVINGFSPATTTAGTSTSTTTPATTLILNGSGFNAVQGSGFVEFRNANDPGTPAAPNYIKPLAGDYVSWSDTQIRVRVPSDNNAGGTAGTGLVRVTNSDGSLATSSTSLTVSYAVANTVYNTASYRNRLFDTDGNGGYTLQCSSVSFPAAAQAPFAAALLAWRCSTGLNRTLGAATTVDAASGTDGVNVVRFGTLPAGVLGVTASSYAACSDAGGAFYWRLTGTDYTFSAAANWYYGADPAGIGSNQYDFQSVALHELGHGAQLGHIIAPGAVMHYAIGNGQLQRTLSADNDLAGARDIISFSTATADPCGSAPFTTSISGCALPVVLTAFAARYQPGQGTQLSWATASEQRSLAFIVESQDDPAEPWQAVARVAAAGSSPTPRQYAHLDARPLAGTRYYRLRQVDQDGTAAYSPVVSVAAEATALAAYPNPATGTVQLVGPAPTAAAQVRLLDATGRCVRQAALPLGQGRLALSLAGVPAGLYVVEWTGGPPPLRTRLVVN